MPYTPTTPTLTLCDDLAGYVEAACVPKAPSEVRRAYLHKLDLSAAKGRQVVFFPTGYGTFPADRSEDEVTHRVTALVYHKYPLPATPDEVVPAAWVDQEVDFVWTYIADGLDFTHDGTYGGLAPFNRKLQTLSADVPEMYDAEKLQNEKVFFCAVELVFRELV